MLRLANRHSRFRTALIGPEGSGRGGAWEVGGRLRRCPLRPAHMSSAPWPLEAGQMAGETLAGHFPLAAH